jgi:hypothetical protein
MALDTGVSKLTLSLKTLKARWDDTALAWNDPVRLAFEREFLIPLEQQVHDTLRGMERLAREIEQARQACE